MTVDQLEEGYWRAYRDFYSWANIARGAAAQDTWLARVRHVAYAAGWKKFERAWNAIIHARRLAGALPILEGVLSGLGRVRPDHQARNGDGDDRPSDGQRVQLLAGRRGGEPIPSEVMAGAVARTPIDGSVP